MPRRRHQRNRAFLAAARQPAPPGFRDTKQRPEPDEHGQPGDPEHSRIAPERRRTTDQRADEEPDHLVRLQLRESLGSLIRRAQIGERSAQRRRIRTGAGSRGDPDCGEHREGADVQEQEHREHRVGESRSDQERPPAPAVRQTSGGDLDERGGDQWTGDEDRHRNGIAAAMGDVQGRDREDRGNAGEHDQLPDQEPECGVSSALSHAREDVGASHAPIFRFWPRTVGLRWCYGSRLYARR